MIGMWTWYQSVLLPGNCTLFVRRTWLSTSYVQLTTFLVHLVCFLPPPLPRPLLFLLQNKKSPSNLHLEVSLDNILKNCKQKSVTGMISLWQFFVNSHKVLSESFPKHSVGLSVCIHQNGYSYILATSFIASFFLGIIHGCSWRSQDSPANCETSLDWAKKEGCCSNIHWLSSHPK